MMFGLAGSTATSIAPVVEFGGASDRTHFVPPSVVRYSPRWLEVTASQPEAAAHTSFGLSGLTAIRPNAPLFGSPDNCQVFPPSVDL
jgi:hypothetical protein